jgi:hypothetical protein
VWLQRERQCQHKLKKDAKNNILKIICNYSATCSARITLTWDVTNYFAYALFNVAKIDT